MLSPIKGSVLPHAHFQNFLDSILLLRVIFLSLKVAEKDHTACQKINGQLSFWSSETHTCTRARRHAHTHTEAHTHSHMRCVLKSITPQTLVPLSVGTFVFMTSLS